MAVSISASASAANRLDKRDGNTNINNLQPFGSFEKSLDSYILLASTKDLKDFNTFNVLFKTRFFLVFAIAYCLREIVIAKIYWQVTMGLLISSERMKNLFFVCPAKCNKGFVFFMLCSELLRILDAGRRKMQFKVTDAFCICSWATILLQWIDNFKSRCSH